MYLCHNVLYFLILSIFFIYFMWSTLGSNEIVVKLDFFDVQNQLIKFYSHIR